MIPALLLIPLGMIIFYYVRIRKLMKNQNTSQSRRSTNSIVTLGCLADFSARVFFVLVVMWIPSILFIWIFSWVDFGRSTNGLLAFLGGAWSHLQGSVTAVMYSSKADISRHIPLLRG